MPFQDRKLIVYSFRVLGFVFLIAGLFVCLNLGRAWFTWSKDRTLYHEVTATRENLTVIYNYENKEYVVDTIQGDSYKQVDLNELFKTKNQVKLYCENEDYNSCLYLDYNYTNPLGTILSSILLALLGSFFAFPNRLVNGFLYAKETAKRGKEKVKNKVSKRTKKTVKPKKKKTGR